MFSSSLVILSSSLVILSLVSLKLNSIRPVIRPTSRIAMAVSLNLAHENPT